MTIHIKSRPNGLFHRPETIKSFTDDSGSFEAAVHHIELLIACERDFEVRIATPSNTLVSETMNELVMRIVGR